MPEGEEISHEEKPATISNQETYQQWLMQLAYQTAVDELNKSEDERETVGFDLRGRVVINLELEAKDFDGIAGQLVETWENPPEDESNLQKIRRLLGVETTSVVRCALDIGRVPTEASQGLKDNINTLRAKYKEQYSSQGEFYLDQPQRMSVIPLYEELLSNLDHKYNAIRTCPGFNDADLEHLNSSYKAAATKIQELLKGLKNEIQNIDNIEEVNQLLDSKRGEFAKKIEEELLTAFGKFSAQSLRALDTDEFTTHFEHTAAHHFDILGVDLANNGLNYITQSGDRTSHNKSTWVNGESAFRFDLKYQFREDGSVELYNNQAGGRVPSIADLKSSEEDDLKNIKAILKDIYQKLSEVKPDKKPAVYNLLTSLQDDRDLDDNKQNESAGRILKGAHLYNKDADPSQFFWVQNIGVNHFTQDLDPNHENKVLAEASLMSEIALLYTLQDNFPENNALTTAYDEVVNQYKNFLTASDKPTDLHKSTQGGQIKTKIETLRKNLEIPVIGEDESDLKTLARAKLLEIYKNNDHRKEEYGNLVQALSIFIEGKYVSGCKSANERNEDVQKRVTALVALDNKLKSKTIKECEENEKGLFLAFRPGRETEYLRKHLAELTNDTNANGNSNAHSHADQSGPSKLQVMKVKSLGRAKGLMRAAVILSQSKRKNILMGLGVLFAASLLTLAFVGAVALTTLFFPPAGIALGVLGTAYGLQLASSVAGAAGLVGLPGAFAGLATKAGYDTNKSCEHEMRNVQNKHASEIQSHKDEAPSRIREKAAQCLHPHLSSTEKLTRALGFGKKAEVKEERRAGYDAVATHESKAEKVRSSQVLPVGEKRNEHVDDSAQNKSGDQSPSNRLL